MGVYTKEGAVFTYKYYIKRSTIHGSVNKYNRPDGCVMGMNTKCPPTDVNMSHDKNLALLSIESWLFYKDLYVMVDEINPIFLGSIITCMIKQPFIYPKR